MKASFIQKTGIIIKSIYVTLKISLLGIYLRYSNIYERDYADKVLRWWSQRLLDIVSATYEVLNPHQVSLIPGRPYIVMSNHRSHYDIPLIFVSLPGSIRMLTKKELFKVPIWGRGLKAAEFLSVDRRNREQAIKDMNIARDKMESGIVVWIAPEGTRSRTGCLGEFKKGGFITAIQTGATIIPVGIKDTDRILKPDTWDFYLDQKVMVNIGSPIDASKYSIEKRDQLMQDVRNSIISLTESNH